MDAQKQFMVTAGSAAPVALDYDNLKTQLKIELTEQVNGFIRIGFLLKQARDTDILAGSEYRDVVDFASKEFHLTKDVVSRYINICEKYSVGGNSDRLLPEYSEYGYSKLSEMLTLPDEIAQEISPETTRAEIQEIKREYREEQAVTPLERMAEEPLTIAPIVEEHAKEIGLDAASDSMLGKAMYLVCKENRSVFDAMIDAAVWADWRQTGDEEWAARAKKRAYEALAPNEQALYTVRIPQTGKVLFSVKDSGITITSMRSGEKETHTILDAVDAFYSLIKAVGDVDEDADSLYEKIYGVAPVQQEPDAKDEKQPETEETSQKTSENDQKADQNAQKPSEMPEKTSAPTACQHGKTVDVWEEKKEQEPAAAQESEPAKQAAQMPETLPKSSDSRSENAGSGDFMNEPEAEKIPASETEIVDKEPESTKDLLDLLKDRLDEPNIPVEDLERITNAMIKAQSMRFDDEDPRKRPSERITYLMSTLVYHIRQWKWAVVASIAKELMAAAQQIEEGEKTVYENRENK